MGMLIEESFRGKDHSGGAHAALNGTVLDEGMLKGVERLSLA